MAGLALASWAWAKCAGLVRSSSQVLSSLSTPLESLYDDRTTGITRELNLPPPHALIWLEGESRLLCQPGQVQFPHIGLCACVCARALHTYDLLVNFIGAPFGCARRA